MTDLQRSYEHCRSVACRADSSFYWTFSRLPQAKRQAMYALYAFSRKADDCGDNPQPAAARRAALDCWRRQLEQALQGRYQGPLWPALADTVRRFEVPPQHLFELLDGVALDLEPVRYETFEQLRRYCYLVASTVGLACIHIWGFSDPRALQLAETCGLAFQLTNILRDLREDSLRQRIYLPQEELAYFDCPPERFRSGRVDDSVRRLMQFQVARAEGLYAQAEGLHALLHCDARKSFGLMFDTYRRLLHEIRRRDGDVFSRPVKLRFWQKATLLGASWWPS